MTSPVVASQVRVDITEHLLGGRPPHRIARELGVELVDVTGIAGALGRTGVRLGRRLTLEQRFRSRTRHIHSGHVLWLDRAERGMPVLVHNGRVHSALRVAWSMTRTDRPIGPVTSTCAMPLCVASDHLVDVAALRRVATVLHQLLGPTSLVAATTH
ncbi:hypothetical protein AB0L66_10700 [Streptomyces sp. NPDC052207]|uniref:hypothetical protein n=1 Tax=Streptomyces sp. NPDC052207 TaxID=3155418 RepID=UPI003413FDCB